MKIVICVKQVPLAAEVTIDPETKRLRREGVESGLNPFDLYAIEEGLRIREQVGGEAVVMSMGPPQAEKSVREGMSMGADQGVLLCDSVFAGSDTWATSYVLSKAVDNLGAADLILCGKQAVDGDTAQVGPELAAHLGWPHVTNVCKVLNIAPPAVRVRRMHEYGVTEVQVALPALLTVVKDINQPRVPTLRNCRSARAAKVAVWKKENIQAEAKFLGLNGSPTRVVKTSPPPSRQGETVVLDGKPHESAQTLVRALRQRSLV